MFDLEPTGAPGRGIASERGGAFFALPGPIPARVGRAGLDEEEEEEEALRLRAGLLGDGAGRVLPLEEEED